MTGNVVENYGWDNEQGPESCNYITPEVIKIIKSLKVNRILDLGSGNGTLCGQLKNIGLSVVGVEYDKSGVEISKTNHKDINFYNFGVQDNPTELLRTEKKFDAVVSTEVVEHLFSPHLLPRYAHVVLNNGGYLVISTPYHGYIKNLALSIFDAWDKHHTPLWHGGHIKFWSKNTLGRLLADNGFEVVGFSGVGRLPYLWKSMILIAKKKS